jgi:hypothetical protein
VKREIQDGFAKTVAVVVVAEKAGLVELAEDGDGMRLMLEACNIAEERINREGK